MKTINDYERERGLVIRGEIDSDREVTSKEFNRLVAEHGFTGVDFEQREAWLKANGHAVTRKNLVDVTLPPKPAKQADAGDTPPAASV